MAIYGNILELHDLVSWRFGLNPRVRLAVDL